MIIFAILIGVILIFGLFYCLSWIWAGRAAQALDDMTPGPRGEDEKTSAP